MNAGERLHFELDLLTNSIETVIEDIKSVAGSAKHQQFTTQLDRHDHFRCITQLSFWFRDNTWQNVAFYIEHPESKRLLPIVKVKLDPLDPSKAIVWVSDFKDKLTVTPLSNPMYVSDEPDVAGITLERLNERYAQDHTYQDAQHH